jgi:hypothetical protein
MDISLFSFHKGCNGHKGSDKIIYTTACGSSGACFLWEQVRHVAEICTFSAFSNTTKLR